MRSVYFDGVKERTLAFALPGTMSMSLHSYYCLLYTSRCV